jgi:hypothetical protein
MRALPNPIEKLMRRSAEPAIKTNAQTALDVLTNKPEKNHLHSSHALAWEFIRQRSCVA